MLFHKENKRALAVSVGITDETLVLLFCQFFRSMSDSSHHPLVTGVGRLAPPPAPPARSPTTELSTRIPPPPPPPPLPPSSLRNGHLHSLGENQRFSNCYLDTTSRSL